MTLPYRQIHLDFHTSEHIPNIGADFDGEQFASTLKAANVDSIVLFAKCHHGWSYYDTKVGARHPNLEFDLLAAQMEACREAGIRTPIYLSVGWDERMAHQQPGWRRILPDGTFHMMLGKNFDPWWSYLCLNTPYLDYVLAQIREIATTFSDADGLWLDIVFQHDCCCNYCRDDMTEAGLDWQDVGDRQEYAKRVLDNYMQKSAQTIREVNPELSIFHNSSMVPRGDRRVFDSFSHVEIEAVPTGGWGYDHFPISARYIDPMGYEFMGVTVRFDLVWGEMGGYKHPNALEAEVAQMQMHGAKVCVGDHLDPRGKLDADAFRMISSVFERAMEREPLIDETEPVADIGVLSSIAVRDPGSLSREARHIDEDYGALRVLQQGGHLFNVIDLDASLENYKLVIVPDRVRLTAETAARLQSYHDSGGSLLLTGESALTPDATAFAIDVGADYFGPSPFENCQVRPAGGLRPDYIDGPFLVYCPSFRIRARDGESLGEVYDPLFNRSIKAFSGHVNTPHGGKPSGFDCGVRKGRTVYLNAPLFTLYKSMGQTMVRDYLLKVIDSLLGESRTIETGLPSAASITLRRAPGRLVLQALYAPRELRGMSPLGTIEVMEDLPELRDVPITLRTDAPARSVRVEPEGRDLPFGQSGGRLSFNLDRMTGSTLVEISLER